MQKFKKLLAENIANHISDIYTGCDITADNIYEMFEYPPDAEMGDIALPCFKLSRTLRAVPPKIASDLAERIKSDYIESAISLGGYLNVKVSNSYLSEMLSVIEKRGADYGRSDVGKGKTAVFDYSSPNVAKPFHIGHLGTTVIGHSIKLIHEFCGYNCIGINYFGDWGTQFGKLITAYKKWGSKRKVEEGGIDALVDLYVRFHKEAEENDVLNEEARGEFKKLEEKDEENTALWKWFIDISFKEYNITYKQLGITFDSYDGESFIADKTSEQIDKLKELGLLKIDDGATIIDLEEYGMTPYLVLKSDGSTLYSTRDIAAAVYRKKTYNFDKCVYITSAGQNLHFAQLFKVIELMNYDWADKMVHVPYGTVSINGEKLATRTGNVILLKDLFAQAIDKVRAIIDEKNPGLDEKDTVAEAVGVGAIIFHYLYNSRIKDINFVLENALSFEGATGPYVQYTYARTCSILEKAGSVDDSGEINITAPEEAALIKTLLMFPEKVLQAMTEYEPSIVTRYIMDVATDFNKFYNCCPIMSADDESVKNSRIRITRSAGAILKSAMQLICMKAPSKI